MQRLVAHKEPPHMSPEKGDERRVGILLLIRVRMVHAVGCNPACRRIFEAAECANDKRVFKPTWCRETSMCE